MKRNKSKIVSIFALTVLLIATLFAFSTNATDESIYDFANFTEADSMALSKSIISRSQKNYSNLIICRYSRKS